MTYTREKITWDEAKQRIGAQGVTSHRHYAFKCPICETVQSMTSLVKAGAEKETVDKYIGFSCEGRFSNVGPWPAEKDRTQKANARRKIRGCNWTLGGLLQLHKLEVKDESGDHPHFEIATPEEAQALEREMAA